MTEVLYNIIIFPITEIINFLFIYFVNNTHTLGNVLLAIFIVSFFINLICLPMYIQAEKIQEEERNLQQKMSKEVNAIKKNFKADEKIMLLKTCYRQHHYHPIMALRTSLSLLIQIPFFMAAYIYFNNSDILQNTILIYNKTLASPDGLLSVLGFSINILPILMTVINIASAEIYANKKQLKDRIQMYSFALIFLILLYNSPAGLVIYWTFNNLFSLFKNIGLKQKNPSAFLNKICLLTGGIFVLKILLFRWFHIYSENSYDVIIYLFILYFIFSILPDSVKKNIGNLKLLNVSDFKLFITSCIVLSIITGLLVPTIIIASSMDFISFLNSEIWSILLGIFTQAFGLYVFFPLVLYYFTNKKVQSVLTIMFSFLVIFFAISLCMYSGELGVLSLDFVFQYPRYSLFKIIFDFLIMFITFVSVYFCIIKCENKHIKNVILCILVSTVGFSIIRINKINTSIVANNKNFDLIQDNKIFEKPINLSKNGKNVLVIFIDRAIGAYARELFEDNSDLRDKFRGFTLYPNIVSFQGQTMMGYLPMIAGYEYTPVNLKNRKMSLKQITNESYLVLPAIFKNNGFYPAIINPHTYHDEKDYSVYNNSGISLFKIHDVDTYYNNQEHDEHERAVLKNLTLNSADYRKKFLIIKKFVYFSNYLLLPSFMKKALYKNFQNNSAWDEQIINDYKILGSLSSYTNVTNSDNNYFNLINNDTIHINKYNDPYCAEHKYLEYEAFYVIAKYIDFLKQNKVFDNTRIIIVSDHGHWQQKNRYLSPLYTSWNPTLMVKDFKSNTEFSFNFDFMTNADMPIFATDKIIKNPINPYTGGNIREYVNKSNVKILNVLINKEQFNEIPDGTYYQVHDDIYKPGNWKLVY